MQDQQQLQEKPALQPKPQIRKQGADGRTWKRPEPAAILEVGGPPELIVYYLNNPPPLSTVRGVEFTDLISEFQGVPGPYDITTFQGVNALQAPNTNEYLGPYWELDISDASFDIGSDPFTFEFWWRLGTSLPLSDSPRSSSFVEVLYGRNNSGPGGIYIILQYEGGSFGFDNTPGVSPPPDFNTPNIKLVASDTSSPLINTTNYISSEDATSFNHIAIQRHNATDYTVHYKGQILQSWSMPDFSFTGKSFEFSPSAINVPGTALGQLRLTKRAHYGTGNFTPPTRPFILRG
jgi:hypothetical protein